MQFSDVERLLQVELQRERSSEKVEFLGLRFREGDLASWGAGIIVIVQLYLWLHLRELSVRVRSRAPNDFSKSHGLGFIPIALLLLYRFLLLRYFQLLSYFMEE